ncbi:alanyl-tRNA editing protein [Neobacillus sp. D3-1R]|uniref:alanyl-tRNA editing protein n=1 Tax=Neobacillus sp. D3-1R TaxID=3445778 RepID=UPI003F9F7A33
MEHKLYYMDSYIQTFTSKLKKQDKDETGLWYAVLEETAFYPTGGGQPYDTGFLNDTYVEKVEEIEGEIRHYIAEPLPETIKMINGQINWDRRFDHMQQHCGQHILSAAFEQLFDFETVGFHLGQDIVTIDLDVEDLTERQASEVEKKANQIILENKPIITKWVTKEELPQYPLRKQPSVTENIRLVIIPEFDYNGCGGTHPNSTGEVGSIKILSWERQRKRVRLQFVCGNRVLKQLHEKQQIIMQFTKMLNAPETGMVDSLTRLLQSVKDSDKELGELRQRILNYEAKELVEECMANNHTILGKVLQNRSMKDLQTLARYITNELENVVVMLVSENNQQLQVVVARGTSIRENMKIVLTELLPLINGRGGGNDAFAQGGGDAIISGTELLDNGIMRLNRLIKINN